MLKKYIAVRLKDRKASNKNPSYLVYAESHKGIEEIVCATEPGLLAFELMFKGMHLENPPNYQGSFSLSYEPTISVYVSNKRYGSQDKHKKSHVYNVSKMIEQERFEFEKELFSRLGL